MNNARFYIVWGDGDQPQYLGGDVAAPHVVLDPDDALSFDCYADGAEVAMKWGDSLLGCVGGVVTLDEVADQLDRSRPSPRPALVPADVVADRRMADELARLHDDLATRDQQLARVTADLAEHRDRAAAEAARLAGIAASALRALRVLDAVRARDPDTVAAAEQAVDDETARAAEKAALTAAATQAD